MLFRSQQMVREANKIIGLRITRRVKEAIQAFQYADDTAVIASADLNSLITLKLVIRLFASVSGLKVNYGKSIFVPINIPTENRQLVAAVLNCTEAEFPIHYLGMPLTLKKPTRELFMPLIEKVERKLEGWQGRMLSRGGRLQLLQSVLTSIPTYYMMCFRDRKSTRLNSSHAQ